jgi:hypothetical protein
VAAYSGFSVLNLFWFNGRFWPFWVGVVGFLFCLFAVGRLPGAVSAKTGFYTEELKQ